MSVQGDDIKPGLIEEADHADILLSTSCPFCLIFPCHPYVFMGIVAQKEQLPASEQCQVIHPVDFDHWKAQTSRSVSLCTKESLDLSVLASFVMLKILMRCLNIYDSLVVIMTLQHSLMCMFIPFFSMTVVDYYLDDN